MEQLKRAKAFRERCAQALKYDDEFALYQLTPPGPGKDDLARSLRSSNPAFRGLIAADHVIAQLRHSLG
jgi:hypothetical protein